MTPRSATHRFPEHLPCPDSLPRALWAGSRGPGGTLGCRGGGGPLWSSMVVTLTSSGYRHPLSTSQVPSAGPRLSGSRSPGALPLPCAGAGGAGSSEVRSWHRCPLVPGLSGSSKSHPGGDTPPVPRHHALCLRGLCGLQVLGAERPAGVLGSRDAVQPQHHHGERPVPLRTKRAARPPPKADAGPPPPTFPTDLLFGADLGML